MIRVVARNVVQQDNHETYLAVAKYLVMETRKEEGCISYELHQDLKDPNVFTMLEEWTSMDHLEAHFEAPHFKALVPKLGELKEGETDLNIYSQVL